MSTRLGTALRPRGPLGTNTFRPLFAFPRPDRLNTTRQSTRLFPIGGFANTFGRTPFSTPVFSRGAFTPLTRQGTRLFPRGQLYNNLTRTALAPNVVNLPTGHLTFTPIAFTAVQDTIVEFPAAVDHTFTAGATFTVEQGGFVVDLPTTHLTFTPTVGGTGFSVVQTNSNDNTVFLPTAHLTFTPIGFDTIYTNTVELPTTHLTFTPLQFDISITLPGQQTLTQTDILAIWQNIDISGYTPQFALEIISAAVAGRLSGAGAVGPGGIQTLEFRSLDNTKTIITAEVDTQGNRVTIHLTP